PTPASGTSTRTSRRADALVGYLFVLPLGVLVLGLVAYPLGNAVWISLTDKYVGYAPRFVGLANYAALTRDPIFHKVVWNSAVFTLGSVGVKVVLGMLMALALQQALVARSLVRALLLVPWVIPTVITALTWHWMFNALWGVVYVLTRGGPGTATHVLATYTYEVGFQALRWGKAVAVSMYLMPVIAVMIVIVTRYLTREE